MRALRAGRCTGYIEPAVGERIPGIYLTLEFEGQLAGKQKEYFYVENNTLYRDMELFLANGKTWSGKSIFHRRS